MKVWVEQHINRDLGLTVVFESENKKDEQLLFRLNKMAEEGKLKYARGDSKADEFRGQPYGFRLTVPEADFLPAKISLEAHSEIHPIQLRLSSEVSS